MRYYNTNTSWFCSECSREFSSRQAVTSHIHRAHDNPGVAYGHARKGSTPWNKGGQMAEEQKQKISQSLKGKPGRKLSEKEKQNISKRMSIKNNGGKSKWYEYNGQKLQGTWELNLAKKFDELNIKWVKLKTNKDIWNYTIENKIKSYTPDFYLPEINLYLEVKGYWWGNDKEKMKYVLDQNPLKRLVVIEKREYEKLMRGELVW